ncbi:MAG: methyltransferase domain-containing protein [Pyrinomonadaceae bacterium]
MKESLLRYLACPFCGGNLELTVNSVEDQEIIEGTFRCTSCSSLFPVTRGIPRFADVETIESEKAATAIGFGWQWQHFTQEDPRYREQFLGWIAPVAPEFFRDKVILEGGCGKGRHTQLVAGWGARDIVGIDLSAAVEIAYAATRALNNAHVIQADIYKLPLARCFDYAFSVGVLHHLPDPEGGFVSLASRVKPGGEISAWVYGAENNEWITRWVNPVRKKLTSRLNRRLLLHLSKIPAALMFVGTKIVYGPLNRLAPDVAGHLFYNEYLKSIAFFGWREQHTIVFDHLVASTSFYLTREEFETWWRNIGATDVVIGWHNENSWRGLGKI